MRNFVIYIYHTGMKSESFLTTLSDSFLTEGAEMAGLCLLGALALLLIVQLIHHLVTIGRITRYRNPSPSEEALSKGLSVIIPLYEADHGFLDERLPLFLEQRLANYEVVVVNVTGDVEVGEQLGLLRIKYGERLTTTKLAADPLFPISTKMALNVGIKAARWENILFTLPDCTPRTERWAEVMARGFVNHSVVLGYASITPRKGVWNGVIRCANMVLSARWLAAIAGGHPYRGTLCNMGFTKATYFAARGFNHLNLNMGEDDLFVQKIATKENTVAILGGSSTIDQRSWGGLDWWLPRRLKLSYPYRYYPLRAKWSTGLELWSRALFFAVALAVALFMPPAAKIAAGVAVALRFVVVWWQMKRLSRRLSERGTVAGWWFYDLVAPAVEATLSVWRKFVPKYKWR